MRREHETTVEAAIFDENRDFCHASEARNDRPNTIRSQQSGWKQLPNGFCRRVDALPLHGLLEHVEAREEDEGDVQELVEADLRRDGRRARAPGERVRAPEEPRHELRVEEVLHAAEVARAEGREDGVAPPVDGAAALDLGLHDEVRGRRLRRATGCDRQAATTRLPAIDDPRLRTEKES